MRKNAIMRWGASLLFKVFPLKNRILISSYEGTKQIDSPFQIYKYLKQKYPDTEIIWLGKKGEKDIEEINYHSIKGIFYRATSKVIVDNVYCGCVVFVDNKHGAGKAKISHFLYTRKKQKYVTTWHGTPLKKMGRDQVGNTFLDCFIGTPFYFIMGNLYTADILNHMVFGQAEIKMFGSPRNDILVNAHRETVHNEKKRLGLPQDKKVVLYAPTFRSNSDMSKKYIRDSGICQMDMMDFDRLFDTLKAKFGGEWTFVCRFHYHVESMVDWGQLETRYPGHFVNGNLHEDIAEYLLCSDVLITDYSSCMFDYAILNKPVFLFCHDLEHYQNKERGFYINIHELPFPLAEDFDELCDRIKGFDTKSYCEELEIMKEQMGYCEEGNATEKAGDFIYRLLKND